MKVDLIIKNAYVFQTFRQCFEKKDIAILGDKFYYVAPKITYDAVQTIDCTDSYIIPGLIDIHMHIESSMTYPVEFSKVALTHGTTTIVEDPHEIANVFGMEGILSFLDQETILDIFYGIPSSVPATEESMETSGGVINEEEVRELLLNDKVICLGEVMNYHALTAKEKTKIQEFIRICKEKSRGIRIEGHCPKLSHEDTAKFIFAGVDSDHTQQTPQSVLEKVDQGMFIQLQRKSLSKEVIEIIKTHHLYESVALITDDTMPNELLKGQLNEIVKEAVLLGMPLEKAIYIATYTPARRMYLSDRGAIAPGKIADFVIIKDFNEWDIQAVYKSGKEYKKELEKNNQVMFPKHFYQSIHCKLATEKEFELKVEKDCNSVLANVIQIAEFGTFTKKVEKKIKVKDKKVLWKEAGLSLVTIFERYGKTNQISHGLIENTLVKEGAIATSWSHDSHNVLVIGNTIKDMIKAQNHIVNVQGGYGVSVKEEIKACASLKVGGIVSDEPLEVLAQQMEEVTREIKQLGYQNNNVIMSIATLALLVSPALKMSDKGLFDVRTQTFEPLLKYID